MGSHSVVADCENDWHDSRSQLQSADSGPVHITQSSTIGMSITVDQKMVAKLHEHAMRRLEVQSLRRAGWSAPASGYHEFGCSDNYMFNTLENRMRMCGENKGLEDSRHVEVGGGLLSSIRYMLCLSSPLDIYSTLRYHKF
jgi:hypothetical protein